jgi:lipoate-protein ligase A
MRRPAGRAGRVDALYRWIATGLVAGLTRLGVDAAVAHPDGDPGAVCFAGQQGSDLRVGARKVCGSAQVHRDGAVLQHGSVLCTRLPLDETQLLRFRDAADRARALDRLATGTVTLSELGAPSDARAVADAIRSGLADAHGVVFEAAATAFR